MSWRNGQAYAQDLRERVLAAPGVLRAVAERFGVSPSLCLPRAGTPQTAWPDEPGRAVAATCRCAWLPSRTRCVSRSLERLHPDPQ